MVRSQEAGTCSLPDKALCFREIPGRTAATPIDPARTDPLNFTPQHSLALHSFSPELPICMLLHVP